MILRLDRFLRTIVLLLLIGIPLFLNAVEYQYHKVRSGDTLYGLSRRYGVTVDKLKKINNLNSDALSIGQRLKIKEITMPKPKPTPPKPVTPPPTTSTQSNPETAEPSPPRADLGPEYYYTVVQGDGLYRIAKNHGIALKDLLAFNGFADASHPIKPGDKLIVKYPGGSGTSAQGTDQTPVVRPAQTQAVSAPADTIVIEKVHVVQPKETLYRISQMYGISVDELKRKNGLESNDLQVGQRLYIVGTPKNPADTKIQTISNPVAANGKDRTDLIMPINGKVTSPYGIRDGKPHKGVDIAAKTGTPIYAVLDGTVVFSGVQGGYGNVVVLEHPNFVMTIYAHNERNLVNVGDVVSKGQQIAACGSTGDSTGSHCHFEYRVKGKPINPNRVLPIN